MRLCLVQFGLSAPCNKHVGAFVYESFRSRQSDSAASACNNGNLVAEFSHTLSFLLWNDQNNRSYGRKAKLTEDQSVQI
jgi:hypothetical protein